MISINDLEKKYINGPVDIIAFDLAVAEFREGSHWVVVGPSGSRKSTLLHCLGGIIRPDGGSISTDRGDLVTFDDSALQAWRSTDVGYIFQEFNLIDALSVEENIALGAYLGNIVQDERYKERVNELLNTMDI